MQSWGKEPAELAADIERGLPVPAGPGDRFAGYAVLSAPFRGGDVLALRRFPASSRGAGYTSVWHRGPCGSWTFYSDVPPEAGCARYFLPEVRHTIVAPIRLEWVGARRAEVTVDGGRALSWSLALAPTPATGLLNVLAQAVPARWWTDRRALAALAWFPRLVLGTGRLRLTGRTPSGSRFLANPLAVWTIPHTRAVIAGRDLGPAGSRSTQVALADFWLPRRSLFAVARVFMLGPDGGSGAARESPHAHHRATSSSRIA